MVPPQRVELATETAQAGGDTNVVWQRIAPLPSEGSPTIAASMPDGSAIAVSLIGPGTVTVQEVCSSVLLPNWLPQAESRIKARLAEQGIRLVTRSKQRR